MISLTAATSAAADMKLKKQTLTQCQHFWEQVNLFFFATRYMWFASINVRGNVLIAPVRLIKSPMNGNKAAMNVITAR